MSNGYRTLSQHLNDLKRENFSLKLRIYFLEERIQQKYEESSEDVYRTVSGDGGSVSVVRGVGGWGGAFQAPRVKALREKKQQLCFVEGFATQFGIMRVLSCCFMTVY